MVHIINFVSNYKNTERPIIAVMMRLQHQLRNFDRTTTVWLMDWPKGVRPLMRAFSEAGRPLTVAAIAVALLTGGLATSQPDVTWLAISGLVALPLSTLLKHLFRRLRPETATALGLHNYSFPSGHAYGSVVIFGLLAYMAGTRLAEPWNMVTSLICGLVIVGVGLSRAYLGAHYPTDVAAGWLIGTGVLVVIILGMAA
jgi:membrane-associated phospholipid phosphatase